jgi:hypothetical protein
MAARKRWLQIAELIVEAVALAADSQEGVGDQKFREFVDLRQQLEDALDQYRE